MRVSAVAAALAIGTLGAGAGYALGAAGGDAGGAATTPTAAFRAVDAGPAATVSELTGAVALPGLKRAPVKPTPTPTPTITHVGPTITRVSPQPPPPPKPPKPVIVVK